MSLKGNFSCSLSNIQAPKSLLLSMRHILHIFLYFLHIFYTFYILFIPFLHLIYTLTLAKPGSRSARVSAACELSGNTAG